MSSVVSRPGGLVGCGAWAVAALVCTLWLPVLALPVTGSFLLVGPGVAVLLLVPVAGTLARTVVAVAASLALLTVVSLGAVLFHVWSSGRVVGAESALVLLALGLSARRGREPEGESHER